MSLKGSQQNITPDNVSFGNASFGNVYIMTHSLFSNVIRIGCTTSDTEEYAKSLSAKSPGHYQLYFSLPCENPCQVKKQLRKHFDAKQYVNEFYEVSPEIAKSALKRELMKIPVFSIH
jgi:hypothetical protein